MGIHKTLANYVFEMIKATQERNLGQYMFLVTYNQGKQTTETRDTY